MLTKTKKISGKARWQLKSVGMRSFFAYFHLFIAIGTFKGIQLLQTCCKNILFMKSFQIKDRFKIALDFSNLAFSLPKTIGNGNNTWENLQIAKHKSVRRSFICSELISALRFADFLKPGLLPRATSRTISFSFSVLGFSWPVTLGCHDRPYYVANALVVHLHFCESGDLLGANINWLMKKATIARSCCVCNALMTPR